jgi:hypothetical protein
LDDHKSLKVLGNCQEEWIFTLQDLGEGIKHKSDGRTVGSVLLLVRNELSGAHDNGDSVSFTPQQNEFGEFSNRGKPGVIVLILVVSKWIGLISDRMASMRQLSARSLEKERRCSLSNSKKPKTQSMYDV